MIVLCPWCFAENDNPNDGRLRLRCRACEQIFDLAQAYWLRPDLRPGQPQHEQGKPPLPGLEEAE